LNTTTQTIVLQHIDNLYLGYMAGLGRI